MTHALVALGSNIPPRRTTLESALRALDALRSTRRLAISSLSETAAVDAPPGSGAFLNAACLLSTRLTAHELLTELQRIEHGHGRVRTVHHGPRTLDLDLVLFGDQVIDDATLTVPHPRAHERLFVLGPAVEIAPQMRHPLLGLTLQQLLASRFPAAVAAVTAGEASGTAGAS